MSHSRRLRLEPPPLWWARWYVLALPLVVAICAVALAKIVSPTFTAVARLLPPQAHSNSAPVMVSQAGGQAALGLSAMGAKVPSELYAQLFFSRSVQDPVIKSEGLLSHYDLGSIEEARVRLTGATMTTIGRGGIIELAVSDRDPARSAAVANALIGSMYEMGSRITKEAAERRQAFYDHLITETTTRLHAADEQLLMLERSTGLTRLRGQEEATSATIVELKGLLTTREVDMAKMLRSATQQHPEVQRMRAEVGMLRAKLSQLERPRPRADAADALLMAPVDYPQLRRSVDPARRNVESLTVVLQELMKARESNRIDEARDFTTIVVLDPAVSPERRSAPVTIRFAASGFAAGLALALGVAFWHASRMRPPKPSSA